MNYDSIQNWSLSNNLYLFTDIFCRNNEIIIICPVYGEKSDFIKYEHIHISYNNILLKKKVIKYIEWEPVVIIIYEFPYCPESLFSIDVNYIHTTKKYELYHKTFSIKYDIIASTLFKNDYYLIDTFLNYYMKQNVECFILYYNGIITNDITNITNKYNNVILIEWNYDYWIKYKLQHHAQTCQMNHILYKYAKPLSNYLISVDLDEYMYHNKYTIKDLIKNNKHIDVFYFYCFWSYIDSYKIPSTDNIIDLYKETVFKQKNYQKDRNKTIVKSNSVEALGVHYVKNRLRYKCLSSSECMLIHFFNWCRPNRMMESQYDIFKFVT